MIFNMTLHRLLRRWHQRMRAEGIVLELRLHEGSVLGELGDELAEGVEVFGVELKVSGASLTWRLQGPYR